jgi:hypothetical protein
MFRRAFFSFGWQDGRNPMANEGKQNIIQIAAFLRGAIQGLIWTEAMLKKSFSTVGDVMTLGQSGPPVGELLPFARIGSHDAWSKREV